MNPAAELHRLGGSADRAALVALTSRRRVAAAIAAGEVLAPSPGRLVLPTADVARRRAAEVGGVVSQLSAAATWGWKIARQPEHPQVTVPRHRVVRGSRLGIHVADLHPDEVRHGVTSPERTLLDCLRTLPFDEALAVADSALRGGLLPSGLRVLANSARGPGSRQVRRVAGLASGSAANPFESVLRALAIDAGLDDVPQVTLRLSGTTVQPDLVDAERRLVLEADSFEWHGRRAALRNDCGRYNLLVRHAWIVLRFAYEDVMFEQPDVLELLTDMRTPMLSQRLSRRRKTA